MEQESAHWIVWRRIRKSVSHAMDYEYCPFSSCLRMRFLAWFMTWKRDAMALRIAGLENSLIPLIYLG